MVTEMFPYIDAAAWRWLSPLRLCAERPDMPGVYVVAVVDADLEHAMAQGVGPETDMREVFADLRMRLMTDMGLQIACEDGTPVTRDDYTCKYCGIVAA